MQLSRHVKSYPHEKSTKEYSIQNGQCVCGKCYKAIKHQSNIKRHLQVCKNKVEKSLYKCALCPRTEQFKCRLKKHMKQHASQASKAFPNCHASSKRISHFQNHKIVCDNSNEQSMNDEQFTPSFACLDNSVIEFVENEQLIVHQHHLLLWKYKMLIVMLNWKMLFLIKEMIKWFLNMSLNILILPFHH